MDKTAHTARPAFVAILALTVTSPAWSLTSVAVPEPSILSLFGIGIAGAILVARYLKKK